MTGWDVVLENVASLMLDFDDGDWQLISFDRAWAMERGVTRRPLFAGVNLVCRNHSERSRSARFPKHA